MQFSEGGRRYIFAASSFFLFEIDELTAKILEKATTHTQSQILSEFTPLYSVDEVKQVFNEIDCLAKAGILSLCNPSLYIHTSDPNLPQIVESPSFRELWLILTHSCKSGVQVLFQRYRVYAPRSCND